jgi:hypothetical protein
MLLVISVLVLVCPDHGVRSDDAEKPVTGDEHRPSLSLVSSISVNTGRCLVRTFVFRLSSLIRPKSGLKNLICWPSPLPFKLLKTAFSANHGGSVGYRQVRRLPTCTQVTYTHLSQYFTIAELPE